ncbi:uncharacterized protein [Nothobranchius furzeri]|uniref:uncharacterized protein n=1 Tax=Nothobranchius furzeri TaxID=105023 RepID=UPI003904A8B7
MNKNAATSGLEASRRRIRSTAINKHLRSGTCLPPPAGRPTDGWDLNRTACFVILTGVEEGRRGRHTVDMLQQGQINKQMSDKGNGLMVPSRNGAALGGCMLE